MDLEKIYFHWLWGDNNIRNDRPNYLINLEYGVSIRFDYSKAMFIDYDTFYENIADIQFLSGKRPDKEKLTFIF